MSRILCRCGWKHETRSHDRVSLEVIADRHEAQGFRQPYRLSGKWVGNGLRFSKREDAETWVTGLSWRWTLVRDTRVVESEDEPNRFDASGVKEAPNAKEATE